MSSRTFILAASAFLTVHPLTDSGVECAAPRSVKPADYVKPAAIVFTPPKGWREADAQALPGEVKIMVVGEGAHEFPPSISLAAETYPGTMKQYLKRVKEINGAKGNEWKDLGTIKSEAGVLNLSQTDSLTQWGKVRMLHVMLKKDGEVYIITAASLRDEFSKFYKDFFDAFKSLRFQND